MHEDTMVPQNLINEVFNIFNTYANLKSLSPFIINKEFNKAIDDLKLPLD